jgi:hypothetical protein
MERAFERLERLNAVKYEQAEAEAKAEAAGTQGDGTNLGTVKSAIRPKSSQVVELKKAGA